MLEAEIQRKCQRALKNRGALVTKFHGGPHGAAGVLDLMVCHCGFYAELEVKRPGKRPTEIQLRRIQKVRESGGIARVVTNTEEALEVLDHIEALAEGMDS